MGSMPAMLGSWRGSGKTLGCRYTCSMLGFRDQGGRSLNPRLRCAMFVTGCLVVCLSPGVRLAACRGALPIHAANPCPAFALQTWSAGPLELAAHDRGATMHAAQAQPLCLTMRAAST